MVGMVPTQQFQQPDITRIASSSKADMYDAGGRASDPPNYHASAAASYHPAATSHFPASHHAGGPPIPQFSPSSENIFRPINQSYAIQSPAYQQSAAGPYLGSRDRNIGSKSSFLLVCC